MSRMDRCYQAADPGSLLEGPGGGQASGRTDLERDSQILQQLRAPAGFRGSPPEGAPSVRRSTNCPASTGRRRGCTIVAVVVWDDRCTTTVAGTRIETTPNDSEAFLIYLECEWEATRHAVRCFNRIVIRNEKHWCADKFIPCRIGRGETIGTMLPDTERKHQ